MSAKHLLRAASPLGRASAHLRGPCAAHRHRFTTSVSRRTISGKTGSEEPRTASTWSVSGVFAVAATAGLMGWGASELRHGGFPGTMRFDGGLTAPRYASMRQMEQVCCTAARPHPPKTPCPSMQQAPSIT